jgi:multiple antibiotic resistance protein
MNDMTEYAVYFLHVFVRFFFLLTPFFALSMFLSMTEGRKEHERKKLSLLVTSAVCIICFILFLFGNYIFFIFGITIDAFRIGAGVMLFLTAVQLAGGGKSGEKAGKHDDITVVPLAIPIIAGPATIGTILVMSAETSGFVKNILSMSALVTAVCSVGVILYLSSSIEKVIHKKGIAIMSKITGLILSAIASQMIFTGVHNFWK